MVSFSKNRNKKTCKSITNECVVQKSQKESRNVRTHCLKPPAESRRWPATLHTCKKKKKKKVKLTCELDPTSFYWSTTPTDPVGRSGLAIQTSFHTWKFQMESNPISGESLHQRERERERGMVSPICTGAASRWSHKGNPARPDIHLSSRRIMTELWQLINIWSTHSITTALVKGRVICQSNHTASYVRTTVWSGIVLLHTLT